MSDRAHWQYQDGLIDDSPRDVFAVFPLSAAKAADEAAAKRRRAERQAESNAKPENRRRRAEYDKAHPEMRQQISKRYRERHRAKLRQKGRERYHETKADALPRTDEDREKHKLYMREYRRRKRLERD